MKYNPEKLQHIDVILQFYDGLKNENVDKLWLDFKAQYGVDPRNFVSSSCRQSIYVTSILTNTRKVSTVTIAFG